MKTIKISELPLYQSLRGLFTIATDRHNNSVKVPLEDLMFDGEVDPFQQEQADWNETDTEDPTYIRNKPEHVVGGVKIGESGSVVRPNSSGVATLNVTANNVTMNDGRSVETGKATLLAEAGFLTPSHFPKLMLYNVAPFDSEPDYSAIPVGSVYLDDSLTAPYKRLYYKKTIEGLTQRIDLGAPQDCVIYCHQSTGKLYRWVSTNNGNDGSFQQVGGDADLKDPSGHVKQLYASPVILRFVSNVVAAELQEGDIYYWLGGLFLYSSGVSFPLGAPSKYLTYYCIEDGTFYRWTGSAFEAITAAPHIDETTGNWFIGTVNTGVSAQGPKGNSVVDGDTFDIVNNLIDGGEGDALSAEMGKQLKLLINQIIGGSSIGVVEQDVTMTTGKYIAANQGVGQVCPMEMSTSAVNDCAIVNLSTGERLEISGVGGNGSRLWAILDATTHVIQSVADANTGSPAPATPFTKTITATEDIIVVVNVYNADGRPPYGNTAQTPYSVKKYTAGMVVTDGILADMQDDIDENTESIESNAAAIEAIEKSINGGSVALTTGKYIATNQGVGEVCPMTETASSINDCCIVNLAAGHALRIIGVGGNASRLWAVLDKTTHEILSVADANSATPADSFTKTIFAEDDCIVVVNVYNSTANPAYGNTAGTPPSVKVLSLAETISATTVVSNELDVFEMTKSLPASASAYDALWSKFVTDGFAARTTIATPNSKPVYCYHIDPYNKIATNPNNTEAFTVSDNNYFAKKKILITSGIHGDEKQTPLWLYEFFNRILYNAAYASLRAAYDWWVVPLVNPTGYDANTRNNYNNVNINRDFIRQTQVETQGVCDLIDNGGFDTYLDAHQLIGGSGKSNISPDVCCAFIGAANMTAATLTDLCTKFSKGGSKADAALNAHFGKMVKQSAYAWPPITVTGDDCQSHEYGFMQGIINSYELEFTQYAYIYSGSNTLYNAGSMVYGNTMFHYLMMAFLG